MTIELPLENAESRGWIELPFPHPAWLSLRSAGDMRRDDVRRRLLASIGIREHSLIRVRQVHSRTVVAAEDFAGPGAPEAGTVDRDADGIVSGPGGPFLAVGVADCMPIFLADRATGAYGVLHSGWRGTGILRRAVELMRARYGTRSDDLVVLLGPCISAESYRVDEERAAEYRVWGNDAVVKRDGRPYLDMRAANLGIARALGIPTVSVVNHCTYLTPQLGSYRREGHAHYTGMLAIVGSR